MKLYDIPLEFALIEHTLDYLLTVNEGEVTPEVEAAEQKLADFLRDGSAKIEAAACVIKNIEADAQACKDEAQRLSSRSASLANNASRLKSLVGVAVDSAFDGKVKTPKFTIYMQDNPQGYSVETAPDCDLLKLADMFPQFVKVEASPKKKEITDAVKAGAELPYGLIISKNPQSRSLRIR
jgi:hypothetical protein